MWPQSAGTCKRQSISGAIQENLRLSRRARVRRNASLCSACSGLQTSIGLGSYVIAKSREAAIAPALLQGESGWNRFTPQRDCGSRAKASPCRATLRSAHAALSFRPIGVQISSTRNLGVQRSIGSASNFHPVESTNRKASSMNQGAQQIRVAAVGKNNAHLLRRHRG